MTYLEYKDESQKRCNELPMKSLLTKQSTERAFSEWGLDINSEEDCKKIIHICAGVYMLESDLHLFEEWSEWCKKTQAEYMNDDEWIIDGLVEEYKNHECYYSWDDDCYIIAAEAFGIPEDEQCEERYARLIKIARKKYRKYSLELDDCYEE